MAVALLKQGMHHQLSCIGGTNVARKGAMLVAIGNCTPSYFTQEGAVPPYGITMANTIWDRWGGGQ